jgi:hypothetical protein
LNHFVNSSVAPTSKEGQLQHRELEQWPNQAQWLQWSRPDAQARSEHSRHREPVPRVATFLDRIQGYK